VIRLAAMLAAIVWALARLLATPVPLLPGVHVQAALLVAALQLAVLAFAVRTLRRHLAAFRSFPWPRPVAWPAAA
jgi:hypothetical protein